MKTKAKRKKCNECGRGENTCSCESPRFVEVDVEVCVICQDELHSIITRRVGDNALCVTCGDQVLPLVNGIANALVERVALMQQSSNLSVEEIVKGELYDNFRPLVNPETLRVILG